MMSGTPSPEALPMSLRLLALVALLLLTGTLPSAPLPFPANRGKADLKAMQGDWEMVSMTGWFPGRPGEPPFQFVTDRTGVFIAVSGEGMRWSHGSGLTGSLTFRLGRPGWIDMAAREANGGGVFGPRQAAGIYKLEKDTLTLCDGPPGNRPTGLSVDERDQRLMVFKRVKPRP
jgi:uncharacterized protein (TIGR03067 family)